VLDRFSSGRFTCEFKYDGERAQIHMKEDGTVEIFSRNSEKTTSKHPRVVKVAVLVRRLGEATAGHLRLLRLHPKAWGCPAHSVEATHHLRPHRAAVVSASGPAKLTASAAFDLLGGVPPPPRRYPDIIKMLPRAMAPGVTSFILDAEAVAYDREREQILPFQVIRPSPSPLQVFLPRSFQALIPLLLPFQVLSTRKRKDADVDDLKVQVCVYAFDMLYLNGEPLLKKSFAERREKLRESFSPLPQQFQFAIASDANNVEEIQVVMPPPHPPGSTYEFSLPSV